jgi:hypothetical protein
VVVVGEEVGWRDAVGVGVDLGFRLPNEENPPDLEEAFTMGVPIPLGNSMDKITRTFRILIPNFNMRRFNVDMFVSRKLINFIQVVLCAGFPPGLRGASRYLIDYNK